MELHDLEAYQVALFLSRDAWTLYEHFDWQINKLMGDQWIRSIDSIGANIAEGFGRFHFKDKIRFYYQARGSIMESKHWTELLFERGKLTQAEKSTMIDQLGQCHFKVNSLIQSTRDQLNNAKE